ncbi:MAG: hypothetical protein EYC70_15645 [Planctomycetota bacterium]|nr:MAG: hypothetical protein EYC70_15645 [Planctomycetota bacterium]
MSCLADGSCCTVSSTFKNICPSASSGGSLSGFTGSMWEHDSTSGNDPMGDATVTLVDKGNGCFDATVSADVCNSGGDLMGPNNVDQNGGLEGSGIEVYVRLKYDDCFTYEETVGQWVGFTVGGGAASGGSSTTKEVTECDEKFLKSQPVSITPC